MKKVAVVTDSAASIPPPLAAQHEIELVPLNLVLEDRSYPDTVDSNTQEFYRSLKSARNMPGTAGASPGAHLEVFRKASAAAASVVYISVSSQFSGTYASALKAVDMLREENPHTRIEAIDSGTAAMAQGFVALEAARASAQGNDLPAVVARARGVMPRVGIVALIDTLEYLARGGRVPKVQAWASALLSVKPILELRQEEVRLLTRTRTKRRAVPQLIPVLEQRGYTGERLHLCVQHTNAQEEALHLAEEARERLQPAELLLSEFTLVMGAHIGPGMLALTYYMEP
jgi:DegV family protein with EDD domain